LSASYSYQPFNKLTSTAAASYTHDNNGNLQTKTDSLGTTNFTWNEENQLTQVTLPNGLVVNYKYDALGRRIQRTTSNGANERYVYDGQDVLLDLNADWTVATTYLNGPGIDNHFRQTNSITGVSYFLNDHLASTAGLTDTAGNLVEQIAYDSFGNSTGSARTRYGYTGRERDSDTGLLYHRARWNDPVIGRFLSEDPLGLSAGPNPYEYAYDNPLRYVDPTGHQGWEIALAGGGTMAGAGTAAGAGAGAGAAAGAGLGAGAAALLPPVAVAAAGAAAIFGAWHLGEWIAEQPWNPLTHPRDLPQPRAVPKCDNPPKPIPFPPPLPKGFERCKLRSKTATHCIYTCGRFRRIETRRNDGHCPDEYFIGTISIP
jgi:RHS repeat-associated protein